MLIWTFVLAQTGRVIATSHATSGVAEADHFKDYYVVTFHVGLAAFQVLGLVDLQRGVSSLDIIGTQRSVERIWPLAGRFKWPPLPPPALDAVDQLQTVHDRFEKSVHSTEQAGN